MNICKNICERYETKSYTCGYHILGDGWKKCRTCCISIKTKENICHCCRKRLSTRKRHNYKNRMANKIECM